MVFNKIKEQWSKKLEVYMPNPDGMFELETDASNLGIGAVLRQNGMPVAYMSRTLSKSEQNYSITKKEMLAAIWSMEKMRYYFQGIKFKLITDHKALEELKSKREFGSARLQRWFERIERFQFEICYRKGRALIAPDALSRAALEISKNKDEDAKKRNEILNIHERLNHRKTIMKDVERMGHSINEKELSEILKCCDVCIKKDRQKVHTCHFNETTYPGEKIGVDILDIGKNKKVVMAIDYFSRKLFAKMIKKKKALKVKKFLDDIFREFKFKFLITDNGKEFSNNVLKDWIRKEGIEQIFAIPYYHKSNGRIERANRMIRNAFRKSNAINAKVLKEIISNYNNLLHRGIGMSPNEAMKAENRNEVIENSNKYIREFMNKDNSFVRLNVNDRVILKKEIKKAKWMMSLIKEVLLKKISMEIFI
jgi:hypothetical protein